MTTKPRTRNRSVKSDGLGRTPVTPSKTVYALMIRVQYTNAETLTITAKKDFELKGVTIDTRNGDKFADATIKVLAGTELVLVRSAFEGLYYIGRVVREIASCTCAHYQCTKPKECKHQAAILASHQSRIERQNRGIAAVFIDASAQIEQEDEEHKLEATQEELSIEAKMCLYKFDLEGRPFEDLKRMAIEKGLSVCRGKKGYVWQLVQRYRNELLRAPVVAVDLCVGA